VRFRARRFIGGISVDASPDVHSASGACAREVWVRLRTDQRASSSYEQCTFWTQGTRIG
jgi:hypothetical protein